MAAPSTASGNVVPSTADGTAFGNAMANEAGNADTAPSTLLVLA